MKRVLITGATGYVGGMVYRGLDSAFEVIGVSAGGDETRGIDQWDLTSLDACRRLADEVAPEVVIHAVGYKDVMGCERDPARAFAINCETTINVAKAFGGFADVIAIGTDYVFSGDAGGYGERAPTAPATQYGRSKLCGEMAGLCLSERFLSLRIAAVYDRRAGFFRYLEENLSAGRSVECFVDAYYSPTYRDDFLGVLRGLMEREGLPPERVLHVSGERVSRYQFARLWAEAFDHPVERIRPANRSSEMPFLFSDLSLDDHHTRTLLGRKTTSHQRALAELVREAG